jgi:hypothetical protein
MKKKGVYKQANQEYGSLRTALDALEGSRNRMPENEYHAKRNKIVRRQQQLKQYKQMNFLGLIALSKIRLVSNLRRNMKYHLHSKTCQT